MIDCFIKKRWEEENILFYLHFRNKVAIRQIDILPQEIICLTIDSPNDGDYSLCDKELDDLDIDKSDYISEEEFNAVWSNNIKK